MKKNGLFDHAVCDSICYIDLNLLDKQASIRVSKCAVMSVKPFSPPKVLDSTGLCYKVSVPRSAAEGEGNPCNARIQHREKRMKNCH